MSFPDSPLLAGLPDPAEGWPRLKLLQGVLDRHPLAFGPLKIVGSRLIKCTEIYEKAANNRGTYDKLRIQLENVFENLELCFTEAHSLVITRTIESLCRSIQEELDRVGGKCDCTMSKRNIGVEDDVDDVLACYLRIHTFLQRLALNVHLFTWKLMDEQAASLLLDRLCTSVSARYNWSQARELKRGACTPGTRVDVLAQIHNWIHNPSSGPIYWLNGMVGTGKTAIAYTLCAELDASYQLGASFFCSRLLPECQDVNLILPSIAYQLAQFSRPFRYMLARVLEMDRNIQSCLLEIQFESLIVRPLLAIRETLPEGLVIVIDALDECNDQQRAGSILELFFAKASDLPVKFLVSSRPEPEIREQMERQGDLRTNSHLVLHELDKGTVRGDVEIYFRQALAPIKPAESQIMRLARRTGILFAYAATVVRYIGPKNVRQDSRARMETILNESVTEEDNPYEEIDRHYTRILQAAIDNPDLNETERNNIKQVLYTVVCARGALTIQALSELLGMKDTERVSRAIEPLWSVLHIGETSGSVTAIHPSFSHYILNPKRSGKYRCDATLHNQTLAQCCFDYINSTSPRFNICELESSHLPDNKVPNLSARVEQAISFELLYACRYWASHLEQAQGSPVVAKQLQDFASTCLLLWMEVMNLKKCLHDGVGMLQQGERWCKDQGYSEELVLLMHDAWRFVAGFISNAVSQSTPHIYVSMLPFWPESSPIARCYGKAMTRPMVPQGPAISQRRLELLSSWPVEGRVNSFTWSPSGTRIALAAGGKIFLLDGISGQVIIGPLEERSHSATSIGYSFDGTRIVTGSTEGTIYLWDAESGRMMAGPLKVHERLIRSVTFSLNGARIITGSEDNAVRVWDIRRETTVLGPLEGHTAAITSARLSPDGTRIVSSSSDRTIRVWDLQSGQTVLGPLQGHTDAVQSVGFSPDGTRIVSGSCDCTICVWDAQSGHMVLGPLGGHGGSVTSVEFSPDGSHIVSGSADKTIRVWDIRTGKAVLGPLEGHTDAVQSVGFSPDGGRIASGSADNTIKLWDIQSAQKAPNTNNAATRSIMSVGFSPDSTCIVLSYYDKTIWIWNMQLCQPVLGPLREHTGWVRSVRFSPDGTRIVSGSDDKTIHVWDVQSGKTVLSPLEGHTGAIYDVRFSPDGTRIVSGSSDKTILVWDAQTGRKTLGPLSGHTYAVRSVAISPDSTWIVSFSYESTIRVWGMQGSCKLLGPVPGHTGSVTSVEFSPDSTRIVSGSSDHTITIWDIQSGQTVLGPLRGHTGSVNSVGFSPNGTRIVSGSSDKTIRVWDVQSGKTVIDPLEGHTESVNSVKFSSDGTRILSWSGDGTIRKWEVPVEPALSLPSITPSLDIWQIDLSGWVSDNKSRLLVWVPPDVRDILRGPTVVFDASSHVRLNFDGVRIGESWDQCYQPF